MIECFLPFKSKEFISTVSSVLKEIKIGLLQMKKYEVILDQWGSSETEFKINYKFHSINDKPAKMVDAGRCGSHYWYRNNKLHRTRRSTDFMHFPLAAFEFSEGLDDFYRNGKLFSPFFKIRFQKNVIVKRFFPSSHRKKLVPGSYPEECIDDFQYHIDGREIKKKIKVEIKIEFNEMNFRKMIVNEHKNYPNFSQGEMMELILKRDYDIVFTPEYIN